MKKIILLTLQVTCFSMITFSQSIGIGTTTPNASSILEIKASNKGLLIPRTSTTSRTAIVAPAKGLMVYDTTTSSFWYHNGTAWTQIGAAGTGWSLTGNAGTKPATNFIGTTDAQPLTFKIKNVRAGYIDTTSQNTGIGFRALDSVTTGVNNTAVGYKALIASLSGLENTALGSNALRRTTYGSYNTALGMQALTSNTTGQGNTAIGDQALLTNVTGDFNVANGLYALYLNTTGSSNTAAGEEALRSNTSGNYNTAFGAEALYYDTSGSYNIAIGSGPLFYNITGFSNVAIGGRALQFNTDRSNLVAIGDSALYSNGFGEINAIDATANTAVGSKTLATNTTGYNNTANGYQALYSNTKSNDNTAVGYLALYYNGEGASQSYDGVSNTGIGSQALEANTIGYNNTASGGQSLLNNSSGYNNTAYGVQSMQNNIMGIGNTAIGTASDVSSGALQNATAIGYFASVDASNKVRIGNTGVTSIGGQVGWTVFSDGRYKKNIKQDVQGLAFIKSLQPITYTVDINGLDEYYDKGKKHDASYAKMKADRKESEDKAASVVYNGFIAQDVEKAAQSIGYNFSGVDKPQTPDGLYGLRYSDFVVPLVKAVQEQQAIIEDQNKKIDLQQQQINALLSDVEQLKQKINTPVK